MQDGWFGDKHEVNKNDIKVIAPALKGFEGKQTPFIPSSEEGCTFFNNGLCDLHTLGLKPSEGALCSCKEDTSTTEPTLNEEIAMTWATDEGREMAEKWRKDRGVSDQFEHSMEEMLDGFFDLIKRGLFE